ncbi:MAG TPA: DUF721 domain-containing protein [Clostridia bacterium]|nr:DUF721 domain-containing protein [Clostridia bacterium]
MKPGCRTIDNGRSIPETVLNAADGGPRRRTADGGSIQPLSSILWSLINRIGGERRAKEITAASAWNAVVGPEIAKRTSVLSVKDGRLYVGVETSTWAHQLTLLKTEILSRLNRVVGEAVLKDIRFRIQAPEQVLGDAALLQDDREYDGQDGRSEFVSGPPVPYARGIKRGGGCEITGPNGASSRRLEVATRRDITTDMLFEAFKRARAAARARTAAKE